MTTTQPGVGDSSAVPNVSALAEARGNGRRQTVRHEPQIAHMDDAYPVVREGWLVSASAPDGADTSILNYLQGKRALELFDAQSNNIDSILREAADYAIKSIDPNGRVYRNAPKPYSLQPAGRNPALGAVYDFSEFAFQVGEALVLARACITVCVSETGPDHKPPVNSQRRMSKFWVRFVMAEFESARGEPRYAVNLPNEVLARFYDQCATIGEAVMSALVKPYQKVLREVVTGASKIKVTTHERLSVFAVSTQSSDFTRLFQAAQTGHRLTRQLAGNSVAWRLALLAHLMLQEGGAAPSEDELVETLKDDKIDFILYDDPQGRRGLFLARFDSHRARFVGLARAPSGADADLPPTRPSHTSACAVTGSLISEYGARF